MVGTGTATSSRGPQVNTSTATSSRGPQVNTSTATSSRGRQVSTGTEKRLQSRATKSSRKSRVEQSTVTSNGGGKARMTSSNIHIIFYVCGAGSIVVLFKEIYYNSLVDCVCNADPRLPASTPEEYIFLHLPFMNKFV